MPGLAQPLQDPQHAFSTYYKEVGWARKGLQTASAAAFLEQYSSTHEQQCAFPCFAFMQEADAVFKNKLGRLL